VKFGASPRELHADVNRFANVRGPRRPARRRVRDLSPDGTRSRHCDARVRAHRGGSHVVFGGFSAESLRDRINDAGAKVLITADGGYRRGAIVPLETECRRRAHGDATIEHVVVLRRTGQTVTFKTGRDVWVVGADGARAAGMRARSDGCGRSALHPVHLRDDRQAERHSAHDRRLPDAGVRHDQVGVRSQDSDVFCCTADVGWVTGHSYVVYGPLALGVTEVMYEGAPTIRPRTDSGRSASSTAVTVFYTAPTAIRAFMKWGTELPARHDLSTLRLLGSVGEPINPEAWMCIASTSGAAAAPSSIRGGQTETGGIMITPLPGVTATKPGSATVPSLASKPCCSTGKAMKLKVGGGYLAIPKPWPGMLRTIWGDDERYRQTYWSKWKNTYFAGDGAKRDEDGYFWILGRVDDVLNVAGHRIGTMEVESALVDHSAVAEAAVVGRAHS